MSGLKYEVLEVLGERDAVRTELCQLEGGARVIVKTLSLKDADAESLKLFEREAEVLRALDHPRIPAYLDAWTHEEDGRVELKLAQRYVEGRPLSALVAEGRRWSAEEVRALGVEIAEVLAHLHALHPPVIHRDLKPSNLLLDDEGRIHLVDFGAVAAPRSSGETVVGTFGYMPPEQYEGRARPASDVYALGMVLCTLVTGGEPWTHEEDPRALLEKSALPAALKGAIRALLERDPERRPRDGAAARAALEGPAPATLPAPARLSSSSEVGADLRSLGVVVGLALAVIALGVGALVFFAAKPPPPPAPLSVPGMVIEPAGEALPAMVRCVARSSRLLDARDRYHAWVSPGGPTCAERAVQGTYSPYDDAAAACDEAAAQRDEAWREAAELAARLAATSRAAHTPLRRATRYYADREYERDDCARARELHPVLEAVFSDADRDLRALSALVDARLRAPAIPGAPDDARGRATVRYYAALGELASAAPFDHKSGWSLKALLDVHDREREAYDALEAAPLPSLPAPLGLWKGTLANAQAAHGAVARAVKTLQRPGAQLPEGWDPTGLRRAAYRALHVGLKMPLPD